MNLIIIKSAPPLTNVKLSTAEIFHGMRVNAVGFQTARDDDELVVDRHDVLSRLALPVQLDDLLLQLQRLS